jgi:hypothetical protein
VFADKIRQVSGTAIEYNNTTTEEDIPSNRFTASSCCRNNLITYLFGCPVGQLNIFLKVLEIIGTCFGEEEVDDIHTML